MQALSDSVLEMRCVVKRLYLLQMFTDQNNGLIQRGGGVLDPPEKPQEYKVSLQYWSGSLKITKLPSHHCHASESPFKWRFAGGQMMARRIWYLDPFSPIKKKHAQSWTPTEKTFWICACKIIMHTFMKFFTQTVFEAIVKRGNPCSNHEIHARLGNGNHPRL